MEHPGRKLVTWGHDALVVVLDVTGDRAPSLTSLSASPRSAGAPHPLAIDQPLVEILTAGEGRSWSGSRTVSTAIGERLRLSGCTEAKDGPWLTLELRLIDAVAGLEVAVNLRTVEGLPALQATTRVTNIGSAPVVLHGLTSFVTAAFLGETGVVDDVDLLWARSDWLAESRWTIDPLRAAILPAVDAELHGELWRGCRAAIGRGAWSTHLVLPTAALLDRRTNRAWAWQVEHNGPWRWEVGECAAGVYLAAMGPTDWDHQWSHLLQPGDSFTSVPVGVAVSETGFSGLSSALTAYRRQIVRDHPDRRSLSVVFNDYMNTIMGDPTSEALEPLIDAAAAVGAEIFCIDAGWYDSLRSGDWARELGDWEPSTCRFRDGLGGVVERIRRAGMVPGLWLEPEVVGATSQVASELPDDGFFQRSGRRHVEAGRFHLDFRHPATVARLDAVIDRLVAAFGIGYFKFDYNVDGAPGTDVDAISPGDGLFGHNRAFAAWLEQLLDRHPTLVIENCASGGLRMDYALLSRVQLQSTSDQQNPLLYPPIAAAAPMSILPEQAANWAYPQPEMTDAEIAFSMVTGMTGRLYMSGHIDRMSAAQRALVEEAVRVYKSIRCDIGRSDPFWPNGLPGWTDPWVSVGLRPDASHPEAPTYVALWRRHGASPNLDLVLPHLSARSATVETIYPAAHDGWQVGWNEADARLAVLSNGPAPEARLLRLTPTATTLETHR